MVGRAIMRIDRIVKWIMRARRTEHRFQRLRSANTCRHKGLVRRAHIMEERFSDIIQIMRITHCRPVHAQIRAMFAQPKANHIQIDIAQHVIQQILMFDRPRNGALELWNPNEADRTFRLGNPSVTNQLIQGSGSLDQSHRSGNVIIRAQLHISLKKVSREDDLSRFRIRSRNHTSRDLNLRLLRRCLNLHVDGYRFSLQQTISQGITITRCQVNAKGWIITSDTAIGNLKRIDQGSRRIETDHAQGASPNQAIVYPRSRSLRHGNLPFQVESGDRQTVSLAHPNQRRRHIGILATLTQDSGQVTIIRDLRRFRRYFPHGGTDTIPCLRLA